MVFIKFNINWLFLKLFFFFSFINTAYLNHGDYNVFMVDWGALCPAPCYLAAIHNMKPVAKCIAHNLSALRDAGLPIVRTICVGHSLGAHICGLMSNYINFRMERIIGK